MSEDKKKTLLSSSMVDLKAELFRKQEEFRQQKLAHSEFVRPKKTEKSSKNTLWSRQNPGVQARAQQDIADGPQNDGDEEMLLKSRKALEEKSKLYDKITHSSGIPEEDGSGYYLVDFQKKVIDSIVLERETRRKEEEQEEEEAEKRALSAETHKPIDPDQEWVEFTDSLGRQRCCMKKDLDLLLKKDKELGLARSQKNLMEEKSTDDGDIPMPHLMSSDMHREMMRQKWENEAKELLEKSQNDIHYSNVQYDEIRNHGVGFFQFSKDHEKREDELEKLKSFRKETLEERSRKDRIKDKRKAMMEERLAKVRQRRNLKGNAPEETKNEDVDVGPKLSEALISSAEEEKTKLQKEKEAQEAEEKRKAHIREWDKEKVSRDANFGVKPYLEKRREERETEFAPPSIYFEQPNKKIQPLNISDKVRAKRLEQSLKGMHAKPLDQNIEPTLDVSQITLPDQAPSSLLDKSSETDHSHENSFSSTIYATVSASPMQTYSSSIDMKSEINDTWSSSPFNCVQNMSYNYPTPVNSFSPAVDYQNSMYSYNQYPAWNTDSTGRPFSSDFNNTNILQQGQPPVQSTNTVYNFVADQSADNFCQMEAPKKPKIARMAIVDTRYVKNNEMASASEMDPASSVTAIPYTPGSFTAAKLKLADQHEEDVIGSRSKQQISGCPLIYTVEEQEHQRKQNEDLEQLIHNNI